MDDVRARIRSHLTALSAASVIVACDHRACGKSDGGYGVVDPLPPPSCVDKSLPTATVSLATVPEPDAGAKDAGRAPALRGAFRVAIRFNIEGASYVGTGASGRAQILEEKVTPDGVELLLVPSVACADAANCVDPPVREARALDLTVSIGCSLGPTSFHVRFPLEGDAGAPPRPEVSRW